jgi:hypothetical protein
LTGVALADLNLRTVEIELECVRLLYDLESRKRNLLGKQIELDLVEYRFPFDKMQFVLASIAQVRNRREFIAA